MERAPRRRKTDYSAPVGCADLAAFDDNGEPYEIHGCSYCLPWHAEVHVDGSGQMSCGHAAVECEVFEELINQK